MRVLVCGDRDWSDKRFMRKYFTELPVRGVTIIEGECRGVDTIARELAEEFGFKLLKFPADWTKYGPAAGPIRNRRMLVEGKPDLVLAFHNQIHKSKGTKNMVQLARKNGVKVRILSKRRQARSHP